MTEDATENGLIAVRDVRLADVAAGAFLKLDTKERAIEYAFRWERGKIADDALLLEMDGCYDGPETYDRNGTTYKIELGSEQVEDTLTHATELAKGMGRSPVLTLRYYIEFDAFLDEDHLGIGGFATWGGDGNPTKRSPEQFIERWRET